MHGGSQQGQGGAGGSRPIEGGGGEDAGAAGAAGAETGDSGASGSAGVSGASNTGGGGGMGGSSGAGGAVPQGGSSGSAAGGAGGSGASGGGANGGDAGSAGAGGTSGGGAGGSGAGAGGGGSGTGPVDPVDEAEPNDDENAANPLEPGVDVLGTLATQDDTDFFTLTAPSSDVAGGYYEIAVTDVSSGFYRLFVWSAINQNVIYEGINASAGAALRAYFAAAPGETYHVEVRAFSSGQPHTYRLSASYAPVPDAFEPNDLRSQSRTLSVGESIDAYLFTGFRSHQIAGAEYDDWYDVELAAGPVTVDLTSVPPFTYTFLALHGVDGSFIKQSSRTDSEADNRLTHTITEAGRYWIKVSDYISSIDPKGTLARPGGFPASFTDPYTLTVTQ